MESKFKDLGYEVVLKDLEETQCTLKEFKEGSDEWFALESKEEIENCIIFKGVRYKEYDKEFDIIVIDNGGKRFVLRKKK